MILFLFNILLALAWTALTGRFSPTNLAIGFLLGYVVLRITQSAEKTPKYFIKMWQIIDFTLFFIWEVVKANLRVAYDVIAPRPRMTPAVIAIPLDAKTDAEITLLANLITLTPGTLSLDISDDRSVLYIHAMYVKDVDTFRRQIKGELERRILEVLR